MIPIPSIAVPDGGSVADGPLSLLAMLRCVMTNPIRIWTREHFTMLVAGHDNAMGRRMVVSDPNLIKHILVDDAANFPRDVMQQRIIRRVTGDSLFSAADETWKPQRKILGPQFVPARLQAYRSVLSGLLRPQVKKQSP